MAANAGKGFLDILDHEATIEIVNLHKSLNPYDFDSQIFNSIMRSHRVPHQSSIQAQNIISMN